MLTAGDITQEEHDAAQAEDLNINLGSTDLSTKGTYPYFTDYVKTLLEEDFSDDTLFKGGLKVYTTLNPTYQAAAEDAVATQLDKIGNDSLDCGMVAIDPSNGYVVAMVGGRDYDESQFNLATQARRQPGSSFKAITLTAAISQGMNPNIYLNCNSPLQITSSWKVQNFANTSYGTITLARATELSSNTGYAQVANAIGADSIVSTAKDMGITVDLPSYASITLGTVGVPPIQMADAYATLASGGVHRDACAITKIEDRNGNSVYEHEDSPTQAVDGSVAAAVTDVLEGVVTSGTAASSTVKATVDQPIAGKTGTTENTRDLWFCGYTPQLSVAVWCGYREEAEIRINGSAGHPYQCAVPIFMRFINSALDGVAREEFPTADAPTYKSNSEWTFSNTKSQYSSTTSSSSSSSSSSSEGGSSSSSTSTGGGTAATTTGTVEPTTTAQSPTAATTTAPVESPTSPTSP
jgi:membrane peptidoglycan carboxypeptidase